MSKKISVILPVYNALDDVKLCLHSLKKHFNFDCGEIIIIDDCSKTETADFLTQFCLDNKEFSLKKNVVNLGFLQTCNKGLRFATSELIVLLNSDTIVSENFTDKLIDCFNKNPKAGVASPIQYADCAGLRIRENYDIDAINKLLCEKHNPSFPKMPYAEGYCFVIRRETISKIGVLDEAYGKGYHEEVDYSFRAIQAGFDCVLADNLCVYHRNEASFGKKQRDALIAKNQDVFEGRWGNFIDTWKQKNQWHDPLILIEHELFPEKWYQKLFSRRVIHEMHTMKVVYRILGFTIKRKIKEKQV